MKNQMVKEAAWAALTIKVEDDHELMLGTMEDMQGEYGNEVLSIIDDMLDILEDWIYYDIEDKYIDKLVEVYESDERGSIDSDKVANLSSLVRCCGRLW